MKYLDCLPKKRIGKKEKCLGIRGKCIYTENDKHKRKTKPQKAMLKM